MLQLSQLSRAAWYSFPSIPGQLKSIVIIMNVSYLSRGQRMVSLRRVNYLLIIFFLMDVSFIDHVAPQCGVFWRPAGEDWANTWDGMLLFSCPKGMLRT